MAAVERRFPTAAVARLEFAGARSDLAEAELVGSWFTECIREQSKCVESRIGHA